MKGSISHLSKLNQRYSAPDILQTRYYGQQPLKYRNSLKHFVNQRKWVEELFHEHKISLCDWQKLSTKMISDKKGGHILIRYYNGSITKLLSSIFSQSEWENVLNHKFCSLQTPESLHEFLKQLKLNHRCTQQIKRPRAYWSSMDNQKEFMEKLLHTLHIRTDEMHKWNSISLQDIRKMGGTRLLLKYRTKSSLLSAIFPSVYSPAFHQLMMKKQKLFELQTQHQISQKEDWYRIAFTPLRRYLLDVYPDQTWNESMFQIRSKKSKQRLLYVALQRDFPHLQILEDYFHPLLHYINPLQLDIFIPSMNFALEYNGEQHYEDIPSAFSYQDFYHITDQQKIKSCWEHNIHIYSVPYWVNNRFPLSSLLNSIFTSSKM